MGFIEGSIGFVVFTAVPFLLAFYIVGPMLEPVIDMVPTKGA